MASTLLCPTATSLFPSSGYRHVFGSLLDSSFDMRRVSFNLPATSPTTPPEPSLELVHPHPRIAEAVASFEDALEALDQHSRNGRNVRQMEHFFALARELVRLCCGRIFWFTQLGVEQCMRISRPVFFRLHLPQLKDGITPSGSLLDILRNLTMSAKDSIPVIALLPSLEMPMFHLALL